jgi:hypothetical protein
VCDRLRDLRERACRQQQQSCRCHCACPHPHPTDAAPSNQLSVPLVVPSVFCGSTTPPGTRSPTIPTIDASAMNLTWTPGKRTKSQKI